MSELSGQMDIGMFEPEAAGGPVAEGYDAEGRLLDVESGEERNAGPAPVPFGTEAEVLAARINAVKAQTRGVIISSALEIGRMLIEAKGVVPAGRWLEWLEARVDYSDRKAQDLMRMYEEYGRGTLPEAIERLDYSKAVELLRLPEDEREQMAERAGDMSVRQLRQAVKDANAERDAAQLRLEALEAERDKWQAAGAAIEAEREAAKLAQGRADAAQVTAEALRGERDAAKQSADASAQRAADALARAEKAEKALKDAKRELKELEAREPETVEVVPGEVAEELERLRKQAAAGPRSEAVTRLRLGYERLLEDFRAVEAALAEVRQSEPETGEKYAAALAKGCRGMAERIEGEA